MDAIPASPLRASSIFWQGSARVLTVVCKATFALAPGESTLEADAEDIHEEDAHWDDDRARSIFAPSDLVPYKARAEVLLVGNAFAPRGEPVRSLIARMIVGEIDKSIEVQQDRAWNQDGALQEGALFSRMSLQYERAAGGPDTSNPIGVRADAPPSTYGMVALPNLQPPGLQLSSRSDMIVPIGFGPIAPSWPLRRERLGRYAATWTPRSWMQSPLPRDLDPSYFNSAPRDQQVDELRANERIILENLHPDHPRLVTSLPGVRPRAFLELAGRTPQELGMRCETLWIDSSRSICTLTWRGHLESPPAGGRVRIALERPGQPLTWLDVEPQARAQAAAAEPDVDESAAPGNWNRAQTVTLIGAGRQTPSSGASGLPFGRASAAAAPSGSAPSVAAMMLAQQPEGLARGPDAPLAQPASATPFIPQPAPSAPFVPQPAPPAPFIPQPPPLTSFNAQAASSTPFTPQPPPPVTGPPSSTPWATIDARAGAAGSMTVGQAAALTTSLAEPSAPLAAAATTAPTAAAARQIWSGRALQLVWFDPESLPRIHRKDDFQSILRELEDHPPDTELDDPTLARDPVAVEDRRDIFEVLARGTALDEPRLNQALESAVRDDGKFIPPLAIVDGEVRFLFDELEALRATLTIATVFSSGDEPLKAAIADAREFLRTPELRSPPSVTEGYTTRVQEALKRAKRGIAPGYLEEQTERVLVEARHYQRRTVYGAVHLRAQIQIGNAARLWPVYVPEAAASKLPMFARFNARVLAEVGFQESQYEAHPTALRALAIARVSAVPSKGDRDS